MKERLDLVAIGNAIVDVIAPVEDSFLAKNGVQKGVMTLVDQERAVALYDAMPPAQEVSGGSASNTAAAAGAMGLNTGFIGKVRADQLGQIFAHDIRASGVHYEGPITPSDSAAETSRSMILVSPDGERSMNTFLGASVELRADDIDTQMLGETNWLYLEGYLFDTPEAKAAYARALWAARKGGASTAVTLSDPFCVDRHRDDFRRLILNEIDLVFANRAEILSLYQTDDLDRALEMVSRDVSVAAVTLSADGAVIVRGSQRTKVPAAPTKVVDLTGAGDMFAAGFLAGVTLGRDDRVSAQMGCAAAAEVISHYGARPECDMQALMAAV